MASFSGPLASSLAVQSVRFPLGEGAQGLRFSHRLTEPRTESWGHRVMGRVVSGMNLWDDPARLHFSRAEVRQLYPPALCEIRDIRTIANGIQADDTLRRRFPVPNEDGPVVDSSGELRSVWTKRDRCDRQMVVTKPE